MQLYGLSPLTGTLRKRCCSKWFPLSVGLPFGVALLSGGPRFLALILNVEVSSNAIIRVYRSAYPKARKHTTSLCYDTGFHITSEIIKVKYQEFPSPHTAIINVSP